MNPKNTISLFVGCLVLVIGRGQLAHAADSVSVAQSGISQVRPTNSATITGQVFNRATGELLPGATIEVAGTAILAISDRSGAFTATVTAGVHTLVVSFTGLDTARVPVIAEVGRVVSTTIKLTSEVYRMDPFVIAGEREGDARGIQIQRNALNPKNVAAVDSFGNPAANPGEIIQRMPGVMPVVSAGNVEDIFVRGMGTDFTNLLVDGDSRANTGGGSSSSRQYRLLGPSTDNLAYVEVIKAPTPDMDASAIAGYINLVRKKAYDSPGRRIEVTAGSSWRERRLSGARFQVRPDDAYTLGVSYSNVFSAFGGSRNLGIAANINHRKFAALQEETGQLLVNTPSLFLNPTTTNPLQRIFGSGEYMSRYPGTSSVGLNVDYKINEETSAYFKFDWDHGTNEELAFRHWIGNTAATVASFTPNSTYGHSTLMGDSNSIANIQSENRPRTLLNWSVAGGLERSFSDRTVTLSIKGSFSKAVKELPRVTIINAVARGIGFELDRRNQPAWHPLVTQTGGPSIYDPASYILTSWGNTDYSNPMDLYGIRADLSKKLATRFPVELKAGTKYDDTFRLFRIRQRSKNWVGADGILNSADDSLTPYVGAAYVQPNGTGAGAYPFPGLPMTGMYGDLTKAPDKYWATTAATAYTNASVRRLNTDFREIIGSGYVSAEMRVGKVKLLTGVRVENTRTEGTSWVQNATAAWGGNSVGGTSLDPTVVAANIARAERSLVGKKTTSRDYTNVFPGLHVVWEPTKGFLARASYNKAISRPPLSALVGAISENSDQKILTQPNPGLKPYTSDNVEVSIQKYFEPVGQVSMGVFNKDITNYSRTISSVVGTEGLDGNGQYAGYLLNQSVNVGSAYIRGLEFGYQQRLDFLSVLPKGFGVFGNFTYLKTKGDFGGLVTTTQLANLAPRTANAGISYAQHGWNIRLLGNFVAQRFVRPEGNLDIFYGERKTLDLKLQYAFNSTYVAFCDTTNVTNEPDRTQITLSGLMHAKVNPGMGVNAGIKARF